MAKGVGLRLLSRRGSWVQIPPSAPLHYFSIIINAKKKISASKKFVEFLN